MRIKPLYFIGGFMPRGYDEVEIRDESVSLDDRDDILLNKYPHRKEEEHIEVMEKFMQRFMDLMIQNQKIVESLVRSNDALREDIAVMIGKMERLYDKFDEFVTLVKEAAREDTEEHVAEIVIKESVKPLQESLEKMAESLRESNDTIADLLASIDKRLKRLSSGNTENIAVESNIKERVMSILNANNTQQQ